MQPTVGRIVHCCPLKHEPEEGPPHTMAAIVCGVFPERDAIAVHYFLPDGANGSCEMPLEAANRPEAGRWWWPPRA